MIPDFLSGFSDNCYIFVLPRKRISHIMGPQRKQKRGFAGAAGRAREKKTCRSAFSVVLFFVTYVLVIRFLQGHYFMTGRYGKK